MSNLKNASLFLKTSDLPSNIANVLGASNEFGSTNQFRTSMTWNNINLRTLLGDMYDKYDIFNLEIKQLAANANVGNDTPTSPIIAFGVNSSDRAMCLQISGLPFINQSYNFKNGCNTNLATVCAFNFAFATNLTNSAGLTLHTFSNSNFLTFGKNQDMCNITLSLNRLDDIAIATTQIVPNMVFLFNIHGVMNEPNYNNDKRLF